MTAGTIKAPQLQALYEFWDGKRGPRIAPCRADVDALVLPRDFVGRVFLYAIERAQPDGPPADYHLRLFGTQLVDLFGRDLTDLHFDQIFKGPAAPEIRAEYDHVAVTGEPLCSTRDGGWADRDYRHYERLILPLSEDGRRVDRLFGSAIGERETV